MSIFSESAAPGDPCWVLRVDWPTRRASPAVVTRLTATQVIVDSEDEAGLRFRRDSGDLIRSSSRRSAAVRLLPWDDADAQRLWRWAQYEQRAHRAGSLAFDGLRKLTDDDGQELERLHAEMCALIAGIFSDDHSSGPQPAPPAFGGAS